MNMHQPMTELQRQHRQYLEVKNRINAAAKAMARGATEIASADDKDAGINLTAFSTSAFIETEWNHYRTPYFGNSEETKRIRTMNEIALTVLKEFPGVDLEQIKGRSHTKYISFPRHLVVYQIKCERPDLSFPQISKWCGKRDHTTSMHSYNVVDRLIKSDELELAKAVWRLESDGRPRVRK